MAPEARRLVGIAEVERMLGVNRRTISRWLTAGRFPSPTWIGPRRAFYVDEVEAWIASQRKPERFNLRAATP